MSEPKTETLNLRLAPSVKDALKAAAEHERRSISNLVELLILERCAKLKIGTKSKDVKNGK